MELLFCCSCSKLVPLVWTVQTRTCGSNPLPCGMSGMSMCRACRNIRWKECILTMCMINWKMFFRVHSEFCVRSMYVNRFLTILSIYLLYLLTWHGWMKKTTSPTNINKSTQKNMMFSWDVLQLTMMPGPIAKLAIRWLAFYGEETGRGPHGALVGAGHAKNGMLIYNIQWMVAKSCTSWLVVFPIIHRVSII